MDRYFGLFRDIPRTGSIDTDAQSGFEPAGLLSGVGHTAEVTGSSEYDEFVLLQFGTEQEGGKLLDCTAFDPGVDGHAESPDMLVRLQLLAFHAAASIVHPDRRLTVRLDMGQDDNSESTLDKLFWSVALGVEMYGPKSKKQVSPCEISSDFSQAFANKPIEIPGSLAKLSFEIVEHKEPPWWKSVFSFFGSDAAATLTSVLGFPGVTKQTARFLDKTLDKWLDDAIDTKPVIQSRPMTLALSRKAKNHFLGGQTHFPVGSLRPGFCVLAKASEAKSLMQEDPIYHATYGMLLPKQFWQDNPIVSIANDPFADYTYAVFRVGMAGTRLLPTVSFQ